MTKKPRDNYYPFYGWVLIVGVILFGAYLAWHLGLLNHLIAQDVTYLSSIILLLFCGVTLHLGFAAWRLSRQIAFSHTLYDCFVDDSFVDDSSDEDKSVDDDLVDKVLSDDEPSNNKATTTNWTTEHLTLLTQQRAHQRGDSDALLARLVERVHRGHSNGWFFSDVLMRLGLIGTVIGFVLMLRTVFEIKDNDIQALQILLGTMGSGMKVALYTTLTGLGSALLISLQCQWLDRCADALVSQIIKQGIQFNPIKSANSLR